MLNADRINTKVQYHHFMSDQSASRAIGADFLGLDVRAAGGRDRADWLAREIRQAVLGGLLAPGAPVPPTRVLAADLGVSRGTVVAAYQRLTDEGCLVARVGAGTVVAGAAGPVVGSPGAASVAGTTPAAGTPPAHPGARRTGPPPAPQTQPWRDTTPVALDLTPGVPDLSQFPRAAWLRAERAVLARTSADRLGYPDPRGDPELRGQLAAWLARTRGLDAHPDDVIVTGGVAQGMTLLALVLRRSGADRLGMEDPGSRGLQDHVRHWGLTPVPIPVDERGLVVDALRDEPAVLVTPAHQFPTGVVLAPQRRAGLLAWATRCGGLVVEDDYDAEHRYDRAPVRAVQALAPEHVAHVGSVSKTLAPGLRLGWLVPPRRLHAELVGHKDASDRGAPVLAQLVLAEFLRTGVLDRHVRTVRVRQRRRRDALLAGLGTMPHPGVVTGVAAGLHLLVTLPDGVSDVDIATGLAARHGIRVAPLSVHRLRPGPPGLVVGYAASSVSELETAGRRIGARLAQL